MEATASASKVFATYLDRDVVEAGSGGQGLGQKGLAGARHSVQENTTRHTHTHLPARVANSSKGSGESKKRQFMLCSRTEYSVEHLSRR